MTESTHFPSWLYHATHAPRIFETQAEVEAALADGWADSPGKALEFGIRNSEFGIKQGDAADPPAQPVPAPEAPTPDKSIRGQAPKRKR